MLRGRAPSPVRSSVARPVYLAGNSGGHQPKQKMIRGLGCQHPPPLCRGTEHNSREVRRLCRAQILAARLGNALACQSRGVNRIPSPLPLPPWPLPFRPHPPPRGQLRQFSEMFMCNSLPWAKPKEPVDRGSTAPRIRSVSRTPSNLPQQSESPCGVGNGALLSSRLRHPQSLSALHDRYSISHLLISRKLRLMNLDHGLLKLAPQIFRRGRALRLNIMGLKGVLQYGVPHSCMPLGRELNFLAALSAL